MGSDDTSVQRWATWADGEESLLEHTLRALECLGGAGPTASLQVLLRGRDGAVRVVALHVVHTARLDGGRGVARGLLAATLGRLDATFEGTIEVRWSRRRHQQVAAFRVRVGQEPLRALDFYRRLAEVLQEADKRKTEAMVDMFEASSDVIRAAGRAGNAMSGHPSPTSSTDPSHRWDELLRQAEASGMLEFVRQFLDGAARDGQPHPSPPSMGGFDDDDLVEPDRELFDAWALRRDSCGEE